MMKRLLLSVLLSVAFFFQNVNAQCPPPGYPPTGDNCSIAPTLCLDLNGYCATLGSNNNNPPPPIPGCGNNNVLNNDEWFGFIAGSTTITIQVIPSNCQGTNGQYGMQGAILEGSCNGATIASQCNCVNAPFTMTYNNFFIGQAYYIVFDGCAGDICDFQVNVLQGSTIPVPPIDPGPIFGPEFVCPGATSTYTVQFPNAATYTWTLTPSIGSIIGSPGGSINVNWNSTGTAQLCVTSSNPCEINPNQSCYSITSSLIPPTTLPPIDLCFNDCVECAGQMFCAPTPPNGTPVVLQSWLGCDSTVICKINGIPPIVNNLGQVTFCAPYTFTICGENYSSSDPFLTKLCVDASYQGCDSTVIVDLAILNPEVNIAPPPPLDCSGPSTVTINAGGSFIPFAPNMTLAFSWTGPGIVGPANGFTVDVNQPGQYCLTMTTSRGGVTCSDTKCVTVTQNTAVPQAPQITGNQSPCQGATVNYTVTPVGTPAPTGYTWTTPNGEPVTQVNPTTVAVTWNNTAGGQLCVTADNACGSSAPACLNISVTPVAAVPVVTGPATVCANNQTQTYTISPTQPGVTYSWTVPAGASFTGSGASITVNFNGATPGNAQVCATAQNACGTSQPGCVNVVITSPPATPTLNGPTSVCSGGGAYNFSVGAPQPGATFNWTAPPGATITGTGAAVTIDFNGANTGQVCVTATTSCGTSQPACQNVQVVQSPTASISGTGAFCEGSGGSVNLTITTTGTGPWTVGYSINNGPPTSLNITTSPYTLTATTPGTYTLTSVTSGTSGCNGPVSGTATVTENPTPTAVLSGGGSICQGSGQQVPLTIVLTGTAPWTVNWEVNGNAQAALTVNASPYTLNIGQAQAGNIQLLNVSDANGCSGPASGSATVTVNTAPTVSAISAVCDALNENFTVTFTISGGDPATYSVTPLSGTLTGNQFTSDLIPSGSGYSFVVTDANNCNPVTVADNAVICDCVTAVGNMSNTPVEECGEGPVTVPYDNTGEAFDGNDALVFILHAGNGITIIPPIYSSSATPEVSFDPATMTYGTTYYLSAVVGDQGTANGVDLSDPCLAVAQGTPVTFYEIPSAALSGTPAICVGGTANLTVAFTGEGPWSISYDDGTGNIQTVNGITDNPYSLAVNPAVTTTYCLTAMSDVHCPGDESGCGTVTVNTGVQYTNLSVVCNATSTAYTVSFTITGGDPASYVVTGGPGTIANGVFTSDELPTGTGFSFVVSDANNCTPQTVAQTQVICDCTTDAGQMDTALVEECGNGPLAVNPATGFALDGDDLHFYYLHTNSGNILGTVIAIDANPSFGFDGAVMAYGTTYYISSVVGSDDGTGAIDMTDPCLSIAPGTPIVFYEIPTATLAGGTEICPGDSADLMIELTGVSPWTVTINGQNITGIVGTPYTYTVSPATTTVYDLTAVLDNHCQNAVSESQTVTVHNPPAIAGVYTDCNPTGTAYTVAIDIANGDAACYQILPNTGTLTGNQFVSDEIPAGQGYAFQVSDCHGCPAVLAEDTLVDCNCISVAGNMDITPIKVCGNQSAVPTYLGGEVLDPDDVLCFVLHSGDPTQPIGSNSSGQFSFNPNTMTYGQQYFITAVVGNDAGTGCVDFSDNCLAIGVGVPVQFFPTPTAVLSGDVSICAGQSAQLSVALTGTGPWSFVYQGAGGNQVTLTANSSPFPFDVSPASSNVYSLVSLWDSQCTGTVSGSALVTVNTPPSAVNVSTTCDGTSTMYSVTFEIIGGDPASYTVAPVGTLVGDQFTSNPILSGQPYTFQVDDANGCGPTVVTGVRVCDCLSDAGTMSTAALNFCVDQTATVSATTGQNLDANDILVYVLHTNSGNQLGTILATNSTPTFSFDQITMTAGTQYYISAVAGNDNGAGGVMLDDPCLDVAPGTPVTFRALPTFSISGPSAICAGETATISLSLTGTGPFQVDYIQDGIPQSVPVPQPGVTTFDLTPTATTTITLVSITDNGAGCSNTSNQSYTLTVNQPVSAGTSLGDLSFCQGVVQTVELNAQLNGASPGGQWSGPSGIVPGGIVNVNALQPGIFPYVYTVTGTSPCPDDVETVTLTIAAQPIADAGKDQQLNCDIAAVTLGGAGTTTNDVTIQWTGGNVSDPAVANPTVTEPGTYTLLVSNAAGCSATDVVEVTQSITTPTPHFTISNVSCFGKKDGFIVIDSFTDGNPPYLSSLDGSAFIAQNQFTNLAPGEHTLIILDASGCETKSTFTIEEPEEVTVSIEGNFGGTDPVVTLGESVVLQIVTTPPYEQLDTVIWSNGGLDSCTYCQDIRIMPTQQTVYSVKVDKDGCTASSVLTVFVKKGKPPVYVPNAFSPNDDGVNNHFRIYTGSTVSRIKSFLVFNRWGEAVFEFYDYLPDELAAQWDGRYRGQKLNPGVYTWFADIEFIDGTSRIYEGDVSLLK